MSWRETLLDIVFPPTCVSCGEGGAWQCDMCRSRIKLFAHVQEQDKSWPFASVTIVGSYARPELRQLLTNFKYHSARCLEEPLTTLLKDFRGTFRDPWPWAGLSEMLLTTIPGDPKRMRERGFDHGKAIAKCVQETIVPWAEMTDLLRRARHTEPNAKLPADATRLLNVQGAFQATQQVNEPVLLVDDVVTTGATACEAARVLLAAGAPEIHLFAIARGG